MNYFISVSYIMINGVYVTLSNNLNMLLQLYVEGCLKYA